MKTLLTSVAISSCAFAAPQFAEAQLFSGKPKIEAEYVIVSKSDGLYHEAVKPMVDAAFVYITMRAIEETKTGRNKHRRIQIIMPTEATNAVFSGTGEQLQREGGRVFNRISGFAKRCNDLTRTYANIQRDIQIHGYESIRITHIGSFVNVPAPCGSKSKIHVPQTVSQEVLLAEILNNAERADFVAMMVHPDQYAPLVDYLDLHEISEKEHHSVEILRPDEARARINFIEDAVTVSAGEGQ